MTKPHMAPEAFVSALYQHVLGRAADPGGLANWVGVLERTGDPTVVLAGLLQSAEYRRRLPALDPPDPAAVTALAETGLTIVDVGAQMLAREEHAYAALLKLPLAHRIIGFEPLADRLSERLDAEGDGTLTLLPFAVGDGRRHTLHVNNDDATSSLFPLNPDICREHEHLDTLVTVRTETVQTRRLDEVLPAQPVDFLKLDVQGAELLVLEGATETLRRTAVVHAEVGFAPIYRDQPLFSELEPVLRRAGFALIDFVQLARYGAGGGRPGSRDRLLWGEAVFFHADPGPRGLAAQAVIAAAVYRKPTLASACLARFQAASPHPPGSAAPAP